jgi:sulfatase maturation enzyme AslB (radical SAM superfamily)
MTFVPVVKEIHVEPTTVCQAECSMCLRTLQGYHVGKVKNKYLTLKTLQEKVGDVVTGLDKVMFCGVLGDPAACKDLLQMIEWILKHSPDCVIGLNTNGALQDVEWWEKLATLTKNNIKSYVIFSIDGLEDTNHIYRKNVNWNKLMENIKAFIAAGGSAHWDMLVFKHNENQIEEAKQFAKSLGFRFFRTKVSSRFDDNSELEPPTGHKLEWKNVAFSCMAQDTKSLYLSAEGYWYPCCYTHSSNEAKYDLNWGMPITQLTNNRWDSLRELINTNPPRVCIRSCGTTYNKGQWSGEWELNV